MFYTLAGMSKAARSRASSGEWLPVVLLRRFFLLLLLLSRPGTPEPLDPLDRYQPELSWAELAGGWDNISLHTWWRIMVQKIVYMHRATQNALHLHNFWLFKSQRIFHNFPASAFCNFPEPGTERQEPRRAERIMEKFRGMELCRRNCQSNMHGNFCFPAKARWNGNYYRSINIFFDY